MSKKGLGRGFESLIPTELVDVEFDLTADEDSGISKLVELKLTEIAPDSEQPRKEFDQEALEALAQSIKEHGVLQPIVVVRAEGRFPKSGKSATKRELTKSASGAKSGSAKYTIVAGERRWRAAKLAGLKTIPAIVRTLDAQNRLELMVIENAQREDLNGIELATAYAKLKTQFNLDIAKIAERVGKKEGSVVNTLRLLNLPEKAKKAMREHRLTEAVMRPLVSAEQEIIDDVLPKIINEGWSSKQVERYVSSKKKKSSAMAIKKDEYRRQEDALSEKYGAEVRVNGRRVTFACKSEKDLQKLLEKLQKK